ncbi:hypothetical protein UY3_12805 [Chelonia mydas]|uniref:Uncharacterized protein n=1 Tax=Chelonia mydas TaxID=8469 RepID=M7AZB7_CHEMY|nr:hypothetical protein UY3_12805 [Chelonia mydas]
MHRCRKFSPQHYRGTEVTANGSVVAELKCHNQDVSPDVLHCQPNSGPVGAGKLFERVPGAENSGWVSSFMSNARDMNVDDNLYHRTAVRPMTGTVVMVRYLIRTNTLPLRRTSFEVYTIVGQDDTVSGTKTLYSEYIKDLRPVNRHGCSTMRNCTASGPFREREVPCTVDQILHFEPLEMWNGAAVSRVRCSIVSQ